MTIYEVSLKTGDGRLTKLVVTRFAFEARQARRDWEARHTGNYVELRILIN